MSGKEKFTGFVENKVMPFVGVVSTNKILLAIRDGLVLSMPVMIVGSIAIVIGDFPVKAVELGRDQSCHDGAGSSFYGLRRGIFLCQKP